MARVALEEREEKKSTLPALEKKGVGEGPAKVTDALGCEKKRETKRKKEKRRGASEGGWWEGRKKGAILAREGSGEAMMRPALRELERGMKKVWGRLCWKNKPQRRPQKT